MTPSSINMPQIGSARRRRDSPDGMNERRAEVAAEDAELRPLHLGTRPLVGQDGVMLSVERDDGQRPLGPRAINGKLTRSQAEGLIRDLRLMLDISAEENSP